MLESRSDCAPEEMTVILLGRFRFGAVHTGAVSGENIWCVRLSHRISRFELIKRFRDVDTGLDQ
jgi:hypothetical protein